MPSPPVPAIRLELARHGVLHAAAGALTLYARDAALLAWLALEGPTPRQRLATLLWPDSPAQDARNSLRQRLFQLKKQAGAAVVIGDATLSLADGVTHDLGDAVTLLGNDAGECSAEFAAWLARERARLAGRVQQALAARIDAAEQAGEGTLALALAAELLSLAPMSEAAHRRLMRLHYLNGDRAAALQAFDRCEQMLRDEFGARPDEQTRVLLAQVMAAEPPPPAALRVVPATVLRPPRLIGREPAWAQMQAAWQQQRVLLLAGEGGLGKSRLLGDFAATAGAVIAIGARPGDALLPYAVLSRLLRALLAQGLVPSDGVRRELARVLPELGEAHSPGGGAERTRFVNAVEAVLAQAVHEGVAGVLVDDLHLADAASVELLLPQAGSAAGAGPALRWLHAYRDAELPPATRALLQDLVDSHRALTLTLAPLTLQQVAQLLASLGIDGDGDDELARQAGPLHRRTGGNPLYLLEAVKARLSGAPQGVAGLPGVGQVILQRITRLSPAAVKLARCAAVAGQDFNAALATSVLQAGTLDLADAWNELEAAQVLRDGAFAHDLIHEAALASVPALIARELHAQIAAFLTTRGGAAARIAAHWLAAAEPRAAVPHLDAAARLATARFRYAEAAQAHQQAAQILQDADEPDAAFDSWFLAAEAVGTLGDGARLAEMTDRLEALASTDVQIAKTAVARSAVEVEAGRSEAAQRVCEQGLAAARRAGHAELESDLLYTLGVAHWDRREVARAVPLVEQAIRIRRALPPETLRDDHVITSITMVQSYGTMLGGAGRFAEAMAQVVEAHRMAAEARLPQMVLGAAGDLVLRVAEVGDLPAALQWGERAQRAAEGAAAHASDLQRYWMAHAGTLILGGHWDQALARFDRLLQHQAGPGLGRQQADVAARLGWFHAVLGRRDLALKTLRAALAQDALTAIQRLWLEVMLLAIGEAADADALVDRAAAVEDVGLRARLLVRLAPRVAPAHTLPLLGVTATTMRDGGLMGQWLTVLARMAAQLAAVGRTDEAAAAARKALDAHAQGITPTVPCPEFMADLGTALDHTDADRAQALRQRGEAWLHAATATLPPPWQEACRGRGLLLDALRRRPVLVAGQASRPAAD